MNNNSHPETNRREPVELPPVDPSEKKASGAATKTYRCNNAIRDTLLAKREEPEFSNKRLAQRIGVSEAVVSQYLNDAGCVYSGDVPKFELKAVDFLTNEARRRASGVTPMKSNEAEQMRVALEYIRKTSDAGLVLSASGEGKTCGIEYYLKENPTAIYYPVWSWACSKHDAASFLFKVAGQSGYDNRTKREVWAVDKLRGSERLIIVDTAHNLHITAFNFWLDIHMATEMPIAFVGTFKLLTIVTGDVQLSSRIGFRDEIRRKDAAGNLKVDRNLLNHMIQELLPKDNSFTPELTHLCAQVASNQGCYRSVHKQLKLAVEIRSGEKILSWPDAFRCAHMKLIRDYDLD
ncbi:MAG TPA: hypothetical protein VGY56_10545 [Verrucomicrobiae bacterium]|nr:hypothetical protein [Verrucomicrobiae bacterium]